VIILTEEVRLAAALAKIRLNEDELKAYARAFGDAFSALSGLESSKADCEPLIHGIEGVSCIQREDIYSGDFGRDALLRLAPDVQDNCFAVPRILE
jgi:aspartyl/glutamyl-tRNA(Asn/Gln) amidotransferase C subunit